MADKKTMKVKLVRSVHGRLEKHRSCVRGLGLRRMHQVVEVEDTPATRGISWSAREVSSQEARVRTNTCRWGLRRRVISPTEPVARMQPCSITTTPLSR